MYLRYIPLGVARIERYGRGVFDRSSSGEGLDPAAGAVETVFFQAVALQPEAAVVAVVDDVGRDTSQVVFQPRPPVFPRLGAVGRSGILNDAADVRQLEAVPDAVHHLAHDRLVSLAERHLGVLGGRYRLPDEGVFGVEVG